MTTSRVLLSLAVIVLCGCKVEGEDAELDGGGGSGGSGGGAQEPTMCGREVTLCERGCVPDVLIDPEGSLSTRLAAVSAESGYAVLDVRTDLFAAPLAGDGPTSSRLS